MRGSHLDYVVADFEDPMHHDPERARGACFNESYRFVQVLAEHGVEAEVVSGCHMIDCGALGRMVVNGHAAARVGDVVYDWTARQFPPHDQPVPLVQPYDEWSRTWEPLTKENA